jgi:hypothetical protein
MNTCITNMKASKSTLYIFYAQLPIFFSYICKAHFQNLHYSFFGYIAIKWNLKNMAIKKVTLHLLQE